MRWIFLIFVFALTGLFLFSLPYVATIGWELMSWTGWALLPGALFVAYIGFVGPCGAGRSGPFSNIRTCPSSRPESPNKEADAG